MKYALTAALMAASMALGAPAFAQNYERWNNNTFWSGAPAEAWQRIDYLQRRIDNGRRDGSLTPREAQRAEMQLATIRRQAEQMRRRHGGRMTAADSAWLQSRLDNLGSRIRWMRRNGSGYAENRDTSRYATNYDARRYYRDGPQYRERRLSANDEVYRGSDGRYYCKRSDGTTGLVIGGIGGAGLGAAIAGGHNGVAGALIGGALGALVGKQIDQNSDIRCR
jgi:hypothetical protein